MLYLLQIKPNMTLTYILSFILFIYLFSDNITEKFKFRRALRKKKNESLKALKFNSLDKSRIHTPTMVNKFVLPHQSQKHTNKFSKQKKQKTLDRLNELNVLKTSNLLKYNKKKQDTSKYKKQGQYDIYRKLNKSQKTNYMNTLNTLNAEIKRLKLVILKQNTHM